MPVATSPLINSRKLFCKVRMPLWVKKMHYVSPRSNIRTAYSSDTIGNLYSKRQSTTAKAKPCSKTKTKPERTKPENRAASVMWQTNHLGRCNGSTKISCWPQQHSYSILEAELWLCRSLQPSPPCGLLQKASCIPKGSLFSSFCLFFFFNERHTITFSSTSK